MSDNFEAKKLAVLRILQILHTNSDCDHHLKQSDIADILQKDYGITMERKAISRNLSLLKEAGYDIEGDREGSYLASRLFEPSELHMLIDSILQSKYIPANYSKEMIEKLVKLANKYFRTNIKNVYSVKEWNKTENRELFLNIEIIDEAIRKQRQIQFDYNKFGVDKQLHKTTTHTISPYHFILNNQRYFLMGCNEKWHNIVYYHLDKINNISITDMPLTPIREIPGFESGINYKEISSCLPYMYSDKPQKVEMSVDKSIIDQVIDWFGKDIVIKPINDEKVRVSLYVSIKAMEHWAMQYLNSVEILSPSVLREQIKQNITSAITKYNN